MEISRCEALQQQQRTQSTPSTSSDLAAASAVPPTSTSNAAAAASTSTPTDPAAALYARVDLSERIAALNAQKDALESAAGEGTLTPNGLLGLMKASLARDMALCKLLHQQTTGSVSGNATPAAVPESTSRGFTNDAALTSTATAVSAGPVGAVHSAATLKSAAAFVLRRAKEVAEDIANLTAGIAAMEAEEKAEEAARSAAIAVGAT